MEMPTFAGIVLFLLLVVREAGFVFVVLQHHTLLIFHRCTSGQIDSERKMNSFSPKKKPIKRKKSFPLNY